MADYDDGASGQVLGESYCMKKSIEAKNNAEVNSMSGYNNAADLANVGPIPVSMKGDRVNKQLGPTAADNNYNYDKHRS